MTDPASRVNRLIGAARQRLWGRPRDWISPRRKRFWALVILLLYTVTGFFLVPWIARQQIVDSVGMLLDRAVRLDDVDVNPFVLSVEARGFAITEPDGAAILGFERLYANFQLSSLFRWAWTFREVTLEKPQINFVRLEDGTSNVERMLPPATDEPATTEQGESGLPRLIVQTFNLLEGSGQFTDQTPETDFNVPVGPINVAVTNISTLPDLSGEQHVEIHTERGANLAWRGSVGVEPLHSHGRFTANGPFVRLAYRYFQDLLRLDAAEGELVLALDYDVALDADGGLRASVTDLDLALRGLQIVQDGQDVLVLPEIRLRGGRLAYPQQTAGIERFSITGPELFLWLEPDGTSNLQRITATSSGSAVRPAATAPIEPDTGASTETSTERGALDDWTLSLDHFELADLSLTFEDRSLREPGRLRLDDLDITLDALSNAPDARFPVQVALAIAPGGTIGLEGRLGVLPAPALEAALTVDALQLAALQPYVTEAAALQVDGGALSVKADLQHSVDEPFAATGSLSVDGLDLEDLLKKERLVGWRELAVDRFDYSTARESLSVSQVAFNEPYLRLLIAADSTTNIDQVLATSTAGSTDEAGDEAAEVASGAPADTAAEDDEPANAELPLAVTVGEVKVVSGSADFTDLSLPLPFQSRITALEGDVSTLDTASSQPSKVRLEGQIADYGLARVQGSLMPLGPTRQTDINVLFRNVALPDLTPYTIRFAGREIDAGSMDVELHYKVDDGRMQGANSVVISDLALGDKVEQPDAFDLPLGLAVALLKGPDGKIDLDVPVEGNVDDPKFRLGGVIAKAIFNVLTNIVTSPFRLLGSLVGVESEDFGELEFEPGRSGLTPPEREKLNKLAEALTLRPQLALRIGGVFDPDADRAALQAQAVRERIEQALAAQQDHDEMLNVRRRQAVESLFQTAFPETPLEDVQAAHQQPGNADQPDDDTVLDETAYVAELERRLVEQEAVGESELEILAQDRVASAVSVITENPGIEADRVEVAESKQAKATDDGWVRMELELDASG